MQYLGGKSRLAKQIAAIVAPKGLWWEPFCGGLSVSVELAKFGPGLVSDGNEALIALYQAVRAGWAPPDSVSPEQYQAAKSLPNSDPMKAFVGFGCSFGGKWFGGYARQKTNHNFAKSCSGVVRRDIAKLAHCDIGCLDFLSLSPNGSFTPETIYCDPPYEGTTGYAATGAFDHSRFWGLCRDWAKAGARVFVSEYSCPLPNDIVWETKHYLKAKGGTKNEVRNERLFRVLP